MAITIGPVLGISNRANSQHIRDGLLSYGENIDFSSGTIKPIRTDRLLSPATGNTIIAADCCLDAYNECVKIARYSSDCEFKVTSGLTGIAYPVIANNESFCAGDYTRLDWPCDIPAPTVTYNTVDQAARNSVTKSFVYTFVDSLGFESQPSLPSPVTVLSFYAGATISGFQALAAEYRVQRIRIYALFAGRSGAVGGSADSNDEYLLVQTIPVSQLMTGYAPSVNPPMEALTTDGLQPVPNDGTDFWDFETNQLAFSSNGVLRFTEPFNPTLAPVKYSYKPKEGLIRIAATQKFVYLLTCGQPEVLESKHACDDTMMRNSSIINQPFPIIGRHSASVYEDSVVYASTGGLVHISGVNARYITDSIFTQEQWDTLQPHTMKTAYYDGYLYCSTDVTCFRIEMAGGVKSGRAEAFSYLSIRPTAWYATTDDRLLYVDANGIHELGQGSGYKTYTARTKEYCSPNQTVSSSMRIVLECDGEVTITQSVGDGCHNNKDKSVTVKSSGVKRLPKRRGLCESFTFSGTAEVVSAHFGSSTASIVGR